MLAGQDTGPGLAFRAVGRAFDVYAGVFARGPAAAVLSPPAPVRREGFELSLRLDGLTTEADDVVSVTLADPAGGELPSWRPGAHIDLILPSGRLRQYSLCGDPADRRRYRIAVRRIAGGGGGSAEIHRDLTPGDVVHVRGPRNAFRLVDGPAYLFVAGGIGITAILPMVRAAGRAGIPWRLVYLGRSRETMPFLAELRSCRGGDLVVHCDEADGFADLAGIIGAGEVGDVYVCGPPALMDTVRQLMRAADPMHPVFSERFSAAPVLGGAPVTVELARSGVSIDVAADETVLAAVRRCVPGVVYSCQQGFCRACKCRVVGGEIEHRDPGTLLESERSDQMLICVSRAAGGRLVLDL